MFMLTEAQYLKDALAILPQSYPTSNSYQMSDKPSEDHQETVKPE